MHSRQLTQNQREEYYTYTQHFLKTRRMLPSSCADRTRMFVSMKIRWPTKMFESSAPIEGVDRWEDRWKFRSKKDYDQGMWDRRARHFPTGVPYCVTPYEMYGESSVMSKGRMLSWCCCVGGINVIVSLYICEHMHTCVHVDGYEEVWVSVQYECLRGLTPLCIYPLLYYLTPYGEWTRI